MDFKGTKLYKIKFTSHQKERYHEFLLPNEKVEIQWWVILEENVQENLR